MIRIVTDSGAHLPPELRRQWNITVIPLVVLFGVKAYKDEVELSNEQFYEMLHREKVHPGTSAPAPGDFAAVWRPILDLGYEIVTLLLPRELSATYSSALNAKAQLEAERGQSLPITIVDSQFVSMAMGFQALAGARAAAAGQSRAEIAVTMKALEERISLVFLLDTLEYLRRGGRIGNGQAFLGTMFNIKPLLQVVHSKVEPLERVRSRKAGLNRLIELVSDPPAPPGGAPPRVHSAPVGSGLLHVAVLHAAAPRDAEYLENELRARFNIAELYQAHIGPVIAVHSGPQAVGLAFYRD
jgi:fatty acid kinase fatty acid binding subunit